MAGVFAVVSGAGNTFHDAGLFSGIRVQVLDGDRVAEGVFSTRRQLSDGLDGVQLSMPCGCAFASFHEEWWLQWNPCLGF